MRRYPTEQQAAPTGVPTFTPPPPVQGPVPTSGPYYPPPPTTTTTSGFPPPPAVVNALPPTVFPPPPIATTTTTTQAPVPTFYSPPPVTSSSFSTAPPPTTTTTTSLPPTTTSAPPLTFAPKSQPSSIPTYPPLSQTSSIPPPTSFPPPPTSFPPPPTVGPIPTYSAPPPQTSSYGQPSRYPDPNPPPTTSTVPPGPQFYNVGPQGGYPPSSVQSPTLEGHLQATGPIPSNYNYNYQQQQQQPQQQQQQLPPQMMQSPQGLGQPEPILEKPNPAAQCPDTFMRMTIGAIPNTSSLLNKSGIPLGCIIHPFAEQTLPTVDFGHIGIVRCKRCRAYINPFVSFTDSGRRWRCNLCHFLNDVPNEYFSHLLPNGLRSDQELRKELNCGAVEFIAPTEYTVRPPQPPVYFFVIDVSYYSVLSGQLDSCISAIKSSLKELTSTRTQVGFITFDNTVHFYSLKSSSSKPHMMVVPEIDSLFLPQPDDLLVNLKDSMEVIEKLLDQLPSMFKNTQVVESALNPALKAAFVVMKNVGGKMMVFQSCLPTLGPNKLKVRENPQLLGSDKEVSLLKIVDQSYQEFALDCSRLQISIDMFLFAANYIDVATLGCLAQVTGGQVFYYNITEPRPRDMTTQFQKDITRTITRLTGFEAVMRVRCSKGMRISSYQGNFFLRSPDLLALPNIDADKAFSIQLAHEENLTTTKHVSIQAALLYTSSNGERRIRALTVCIPVTSSLNDIYKTADLESIMNLLGKLAIEKALSSKLLDAREAVLNKCVDILLEYRNSFAGQNKVANQMMIPEKLNLLPLFTLALIKSTIIRSGNDLKPDERAYHMYLFRTFPVFLSTLYLHPALYSLTEIPQSETLILPPVLELSSEKLDRRGIYLLDNGQSLFLWVGRTVSPEFLNSVFNVSTFEQIDQTQIELPRLNNPISNRINAVIDHLRSKKPCYQRLIITKEGDPTEIKFFSLLVQDRTKNFNSSYQEFVRELQKLVQSKVSK